jgi:hypothetical protein
MRTYYKGPDAIVTSESFTWRTGRQHVFAVRDLRNVSVVRSVKRTSEGIVPAISIGVSVLVSSVTAASLVRGAAAWVVGAFVSLAALGYSWQAVRSRPKYWEIRAQYRGVDTVLYSNRDLRIFNQVARAFRRAIEDALPPASYPDEGFGKGSMDRGVA